MAYEMNCSCGNGLAGFNFRDEIMTGEVISRLYCPQCSRDIKFDQETMVADNGWVIEYDMDIARFQAQKIKADALNITPDFIFDESYCTWRGIYPTDHIDSVVERTEIMKLAKINPRKYLEELKEWANTRMERLSKEGWRKANEGNKGGV
ncbi:MAG: hypothetical protein M1508_10680 [Nitrospirae bacterium]|nr:hypothetical protein [Nitrospirota bacterium]MCL5421392.1 hypothetical protein [Nitrospirota bacterium]